MAADPITKSTIDDLLRYDFDDDDDPFADKPTTKRDDKAILSPRGTKRAADDNNKENFGGLGLDEEVKIKKQRIPIPKLDDQRLLSEPGIPRLRKLARSGKIAKRLGFKGKGHEFSDVAKLLNYYQLWLDDLFPRAKFADGLVMVEKAGHSKRMQVMRKEWIDEGKPGYARHKTDEEVESREEHVEGAAEEVAKPDDAEKGDEGDLFFPDANAPKDQAVDDDAPEDDELDALLAEEATRSAPAPVPAPQEPARDQPDSEGEDDLDALLKEQDSRRTTQPLTSTSEEANVEDENREDGDEDDLDALLAAQDTHTSPQVSPPRSKPTRSRNTIFDDDDDGDDDLDALLAEQEERHEPSPQATTPGLPAKETSEVDAALEAEPEAVNEDVGNVLSSSPLPDNPEETDLADLLSSPIRG